MMRCKSARTRGLLGPRSQTGLDCTTLLSHPPQNRYRFLAVTHTDTGSALRLLSLLGPVTMDLSDAGQGTEDKGYGARKGIHVGTLACSRLACKCIASEGLSRAGAQ